ncbi:MAG: signal transduction histidine kinase/ligand-binding sensor domain-containing protein [Candidatus Latescibacterota bacterium]|jgi:signal transduction histidine kinase/ligand-binding sensor domain-containing protein/DNA-binding response OmpR family regulator
MRNLYILCETTAMHALLLLFLMTAPVLAVDPPALPRPPAAEPTLARLSFWVKSERMDDFATTYQSEIRPYLREFGIEESSIQGRAPVADVFSRLYEFATPADWIEAKRAMREDPRTLEFHRHLGDIVQTDQADGYIKNIFRLYYAPAGPGSSTVAGPGQTRATGEGRGQWKTYDVTNGLAGPWVRTILQDNSGHLWFATINNGVSCYDGQTWTSFSSDDGLISNQLRSMSMDRDGHMWFGTRHGVSRFDGETWTSYTTADGLADNRVTDIVQDRDGLMWFATYGGGISRYDGESWQTYTSDDGLAANEVRHILQDRDGHLWFATQSGVSRFDGETWKTFTAADGLASDRILSTFQSKNGALWFSGTEGATRFDGETWKIFSEDDGLLSNFVTDTFQDRDGYMWFATHGGGVSRFDGLDEWTSFTTKDGLAYGKIWNIIQDHEGYLWFATSGGVSRYDTYSIKYLGAEEGFGDYGLSKIYRGRDALWLIKSDPLGQGNGLSRYDGTSITDFTLADGLPSERVFNAFEDRSGALWMSTDIGVSRYDGQTWTTYGPEDGLGCGLAANVYEDRDGSLWFSSWEEGIAHFDGETFTSYSSVDGLVSDHITVVFQDRDGYMWFGSSDEGLSRFDGERFETFSEENGLGHNDILDIAQDDNGHLWFATHGGIARFDGENFKNWTTRDGLASNDVHDVSIDSRGHIWIGTDGGGISHFDGEIFQNLTRQDGLASNVALSLTVDADDAVWIASDKGLLRYKPQRAPLFPVSVKTVVADRRYSAGEGVSIPSDAGLVAFEFGAKSIKTRPGQILYLYRLLGHEEGWQKTRANRVEYSQLPRGDYTFQVRAVDRDLNYSNATAELPLKIHAPYGQIAWGSGLSLALALIAVLGVHLARSARQLQHSNQELSTTNYALQQAKNEAEISQAEAETAQAKAEDASRAKSIFLANISHEIRTPMNAILGYAQILRHSNELPPKHRQAVETIESSGNHLLDLINEVLDLSKIEAGRMEIQQGDFDLNSLLHGLAVMFELRCLEKGLDWHLHAPSSGPCPVRSDAAKINQVLINLLGNGVKFTSNGTVSLEVERVQGKHFHFSVIDTGAGISDADQEHLFEPFHQGAAGLEQGGTGLGLSIARRHIELLGGQLDVESEPDRGSRFSFTIELAPASSALAPAYSPLNLPVRGLASGHAVSALIVDDVRENRDVLAHILSGLGAEVSQATNGLDALEQVKTKRPDIVFMDIRMPGIDGSETLRRLHQLPERQDVPVVAISASVLDHERREFLSQGFVDFIAKPFRFEQICSSLQEQLDIEYEYAEMTPSSESAPAWEELSLPADLVANLQQATRLNNITTIEKHLRELEQLGESKLAQHLRQLKQRFDMDSILNILGQVHHA